MGGKHKHVQRTKNSTRPSSSGRSADFLGNSSLHPSVKETGFILPSFSLSNAEDDLTIDTNFQLVFKKMNKKDATTKLKALRECSELFKNTDIEAIKAVLPFWPRLYNVLATDSEHRVREAAHVAHNELVLKVKRNLSPYLKQLIGPWFTSQYDTHPPAGSAATLSFKNAFPENKIEEVILFGEQEILTYIYDNLMIQSTQTVSNSKSLSSEESEAKYERIVISSLMGYAFYLKKVSSVKEKAIELNQKIVTNDKFWQYSKHKISTIRAAWFEVLASLFTKASFLLDKEDAHVVSSIFINLDEKEPNVLPHVWQSVLLMITYVKDWWSYVNVEKLVFAKLWIILKEGGQGNATVIYPNLLPFISNIPPETQADKFFNNFFENLRFGFKQKTVLSSRSEFLAVATAFTECLQYVVMKHQLNMFLCEKLIKTHLIATIEWSWMETQSSYKVLFNQIAGVIQCWSRNQTQKDYENYSKYLDYFWSNLTSLFQGVLLNMQQSYDLQQILEICNRQVDLLLLLKHTAKTKKNLKVKFTVNSEAKSSPHINVKTVHVDKSYIIPLTELVHEVCIDYVKFIEEKKLKQLVEHLLSLVQSFDSEVFFLRLCEKLETKNESSNLINVFNNVFKKWLNSEEMCSRHLVHMIFLLYKYLPEDSKLVFLNGIEQVSNKDILGWCICEALAHPYNTDVLISHWLKDVRVTNFLVEVTEKQVTDECSSDLSALLKLAITETGNGKLFISKDAIFQIIKILKSALLHTDQHVFTIDSCASLSAFLSSVIYTENLMLTYGDDLLLSLFNLSCITPVNLDSISADTLWEVQTACQDALLVLTKGLESEDCMNLLEKLMVVLEDTFVANNNLNQAQLDKLIDVAVNLVRILYRTLPSKIDVIIQKLFNRNFVLKWNGLITDICKYTETLWGNLSCPYDDINVPFENIDEIDIFKYFLWSYFKLSVITSYMEENDNYQDDDADEIGNETKVLILNALDCNEYIFCDLFYDITLASTCIKNFELTKYAKDINYYIKEVNDKCEIAFNNSHKDLQAAIQRLLVENVRKHAWLWCTTIYNVYDNKLPSLVDIYRECVEDLSLDNKLPVYHMTQVFAKYLNYDYIWNKYDTVGDAIILRNLLHCTELDVQIAEVFVKLNLFKIENSTKFFFASLEINWQEQQLILETIRLSSGIIKNQFDVISKSYLDFILISLTSWSSNVLKLHDKHKNNALLIAIMELYSNIIDKVKQLEATNPNHSFVKEWDDLFAPNIQTDLMKIWLFLAKYFQQIQKKLKVTDLPLAQSFVTVVDSFDYKHYLKNFDNNLTFLECCCSLLKSPSTTLQLGGYKMLLVLIPALLEIDVKAIDSNKPRQDGLILNHFKDILMYTHEIVNAMLLDFKLGEDSCSVEPSTDSFTFTLAYLLVWDILLTLCENSSTELRYQYADWLRCEDLLKYFFQNVFRLMPTEILHYSERKKLSHPEWFVERPILNCKENVSQILEHLVCWVFASALSQLPALVRQWWSSSENRISRVVEGITTAYVSPQLCAQELSDVSQHKTQFKNMAIKVMPSVREVVAVYTVDEAQMELVITLPQNYPLAGPTVYCNKQIGGTSHKQWLMQLKKCLLHQNGRIWDGLCLWNNNLDKKFDGVEECYICFSVLHPGTYQLPKVSCQTCKKKFHSACLYKWFSTSNKSTCPICRNLF